jgi:hypothetical protein
VPAGDAAPGDPGGDGREARAERPAIRAEPLLPEEGSPERERLDCGQRRMVRGLLAAAAQRPPAWADPASVPPPGAWCTCCGRHHRRGGRWWCEAGERPRGWRCWTCYPPDHLPAEAVREVRT